MSIAEMRKEMVDMITKLDENEVEETYGALLNHFSGKIDDWDELPTYMKAKIEQGLKEIEKGEVFSLESVVNEASSRYGNK